MSRMARPRDLNFTTELNSVVNNRREHSKRAAVLIREPSSEVIDVDEAGGNTKKDNNKDVIILVRDRKNLSLALRKLQCCSQCFSPNIQSCQCRQRQDSTVSVISNGSLNKCHKCKDVEETVSRDSVDEVDGSSSRRKNSTAVIVDAFFKLAFLKILLIDIGISLGDTVTDFLQGFNLILDFTDLSIRWASLNYGLAIIFTSWVPLIVVFLHMGFSRESNMFRFCRNLPGIIGMLGAMVIFPVVPTLMYALLMLSPRQSAVDRRRYKNLERQSHEIKSICGSLESPIQLVLLLFLMMRGILTLPWNEPPKSTCVTDSLGRVACLPSVPMASVIFSVLSIIKAVFDLNIYPLVREYETSSRTVRMSFNLLLKFLPCFLSNALFRISAISIMFVYLDWWSVIPCLLLFLVNLMTFGVSFKRFGSSPSHSICEDQDMNSVQLNRLSTMDYTKTSLQFGSSHSDLPRTPTEEEKMKTVVGWVPPNDLPRTSTHLKPYKYDQIGWNTNLGIISPPTPSPNIDTVGDQAANTNNTVVQTQPDGVFRSGSVRGEQGVNLIERMQSLISSSDKTDTPSYINEENTSIFLNAVTGMFFPSCHTHLEAIGPDLAGSDPQTFYIRNKERQDKLILWQCNIYQRQVYLFNSLLMIIITVVVILVSSVQSFNYYTNVIDSFWFAVTMSMLLMSGFLSIGLTWSLTRNVSSLTDKSSSITHSQSYETDSYGCSSPTSARRNKYYDSLSCRRLFINCCICTIALVIVFVPVIICLITFSSVSKADPYIFLITQDGDSEKVDLSIITAFPVKYPQSNKMDVTQGRLELDCFIDQESNYNNKILIINASRPQCKTLLSDNGFYMKAVKSQASGIILLDDTPKSKWRVSSPSSEKVHSLVMKDMEEDDDIPFLLIRQSDWKKFDSQFLWLAENDKEIFLVWNDPKLLDLNDIFSCTDNKTVSIDSRESRRSRRNNQCSDGKHLYQDGSLKEKICGRGQCSIFGQSCPHSLFEDFKQFSREVQCESLTDINLEISRHGSPSLEPSSLTHVINNIETDYCCKNDNSTFTEVLGSGCFQKWREVKSFLPQCQFSDWITGECVRGQQQHYRLCLVSVGGCDNVIRESFTTLCHSDDVLPLCSSNFC